MDATQANMTRTLTMAEVEARLVRAERRLSLLREITAHSPEGATPRLRLELAEAERLYEVARQARDALIANGR